MSTITSSLSAVDPITPGSLEELAAVQAGPRISLYVPTHRSGPETLKDPVRLRNLLDRAEAVGAPPSVLAPARELLDDAALWQHQAEGLAVFAAPDLFRTFRLPVEVGEHVDVSDSFRVRPLVPLLSDHDTFRILALSQKSVRLFQADRYRIDELDLDGTTASMSEALAYDDDTPRVTRRGGSTGQIHGHGGAEELDREHLERFFRAVDHDLHERFGVSGAPLVLATVAHYQPIYASVSTAHTVVLDEVAEGNPERRSPAELHAEAWGIANRHLSHERRSVWHRFQDASASGLTATDLSTVVLAAAHGRIDTLFVAPGPPILGSVDVDTATVRVAGSDAPSEEFRIDLVDQAVLDTVSHGGAVHSVDSTDLPAGSPAGALLRY